MIDASEIEVAAMHQCLKAFGSAGAEIGFDKPLGQYSQEEALLVIDAIVSCWTQAMVEHHEASKCPPIKGSPIVTDPFNDMSIDCPWDEAKGAGT